MKRAIPDFLTGRPAVYRLYARDGGLLYIGSTKDVARRLTSHRGARVFWMPLVARMRVTLHPTREAARQAEEQAVRAEHPLFNTQWHSAPRDLVRCRKYLRQLEQIPGKQQQFRIYHMRKFMNTHMGCKLPLGDPWRAAS